MMLLMGINMSFTKKPTNPITTNPIAVRKATFVNSETTTKRVFLDRIHNKIESKREKRKRKERVGGATNLCDRACGSA
jgi:hypothetical protein